jgi:hypothetical protein
MKLAWQGVSKNLLYGDFVECWYPFTKTHPLAQRSVDLATILAGVTIYMGRVRASAYLPLPLGLFLCEGSASHMALASFVAFLIPFVGTLLSYVKATKTKTR